MAEGEETAEGLDQFFRGVNWAGNLYEPSETPLDPTGYNLSSNFSSLQPLPFERIEERKKGTQQKPYVFKEFNMDGKPKYFIAENGEISPWSGARWEHDGSKVTNLQGQSIQWWQDRYDLYNSGFDRKTRYDIGNKVEFAVAPDGSFTRIDQDIQDQGFKNWLDTKPQYDFDELKFDDETADEALMLYEEDLEHRRSMSTDYDAWLDGFDNSEDLPDDELRDVYNLQKSPDYQEYLQKLRGIFSEEDLTDEQVVADYEARLNEADNDAATLQAQLDDEITLHKQFEEFKLENTGVSDDLAYHLFMHQQSERASKISNVDKVQIADVDLMVVAILPN